MIPASSCSSGTHRNGSVGFDECWADHIVLDIGGLAVPFIDVDHLIVNKRASGRLQDLADAEALTSDDRDASE